MYFSICIPTYNRAHTVRRTLDSLNRQIFKDFEVIIVDDGSKDDLKSLVDEFQKESNMQNINYIYKENGGKHTALNRGITVANGTFFLILDSDDWLADDALFNMHKLCLKIEENNEFCGVMGRCVNSYNGEMIGERFPYDPFISSYVDFHFRLGLKQQIGDCCECNKTAILKQYHYPESEKMRFVPEAWLFDQIGVKYNLYCTNLIFEYKEYRVDGISLDTEYKKKNNIGFLHHYISRIENVFPYVDVSLKWRIIAWWRYWEAVKKDAKGEGPRCKKISLLGYLVKCVMPLILIVYKLKYKDLYKAGR